MLTEATTVQAGSAMSRRAGVLLWVQNPFVSMLLLAGAILFAGLGQGDIRIDGPIYAWVAKRMVISGDWLNLYYDHGQTAYFNKPPLQFWLMAAVFKAIGYSTFSAKLVSVLFGIGCVAMVYVIARLRFEPALAASAGIVLATTYTFIRNTAAVRLDAGVTFFFLAALYPGARMLLVREPRLRLWIMLGAACGLALMIKSGAALLCLPILIGAFVWNRRWDLLWNWRGLVALALCAAIVLPWYLHQYYTWGQAFTDQHFRQQLIGRFESVTFGSTAWYAYLRDLGTRYVPWIVFVIFGTYRLFRTGRSEPHSAEDQALDRLFVLWAFGSLLVLHLLPRKYDRYLLFVYPALAVLAAYGLRASVFGRHWKTFILPNLGWASALTVTVLQLLHVQFHVTAYPELAQAVPTINQGHSTVYAVGRVPMSVQCNIRFFTNAKVEPIDETKILNVRAGDVLVLPRAQQSTLMTKIPPHQMLAQGKELIFLAIH